MSETYPYSLSWDESNSVYLLMCGCEIIGRLPDNTDFAQRVMRAFNDADRMYSIRGRIVGVIDGAKAIEKALKDYP